MIVDAIDCDNIVMPGNDVGKGAHPVSEERDEQQNLLQKVLLEKDKSFHIFIVFFV